FDRIVIYGYLSGLSRPEQVVHFFRNVVGLAVVDKEVLSRRTADYQAWVEAFARNHRLPIEWAEKGVRKEDHVLPWQRLEVLLNSGSHIGGWTAKQIHHAVITTFDLSDSTYRLDQLRYDLRKLKGHGLLQRDGSRYAYRLTPKGVQVAPLFLFFHKRLCGPLANSRFHHRPDPQHRPPGSALQTAGILLLI